MTAQLFGYDIIPPVELISDKNETVSKNGNLDQRSFRTSAQRYGFRVGLMPDPKGVRKQTATIDAYRELYGYTDRFDFEVPQEWGIVLPEQNVVTSAAITRDTSSIAITKHSGDDDLEIGTRFQFAGFDKLYKITEYTSSSQTTGIISVKKNVFQDNIPSGTQLIFAPVAKCVIDAEEPIRIVYENYQYTEMTIMIREQGA